MLRKQLAKIDAAQLLADLNAHGKVVLSLGESTLDKSTGENGENAVELDCQDLMVRLQAKEGWAAAQGCSCVVVLSTELTDSLLREGLARELVHAIQSQRKDRSCDYTDRIGVGIVTESAAVLAALESFGDYICTETLAVELKAGPLSDIEPIELDLGGEKLQLYVKTVKNHG